MTLKPLISIIVPVYNAKKYIRECVESIITQYDFESTELILVDDGSTDVSSAICQMYAERFQNVIYYRQQNSGVSAARNKGVELSSGEYIFFVDADDFLFGSTLKSIKNSIEKNNPQIIFFDFKYEYPDGYNEITFPFPKGEIIKGKAEISTIADFMLTDSSFNCVWNKVFKKDVITDNGLYFDTDKKYGEDKRFVLDFLEKAETAFYLGKMCYFYRYVDSGAIQRLREDYFADLTDDYYYSLNKYNAFDINKADVEKKSKSFLAIKIISCVEMAFKKSDKKTFKKILQSAFNDKKFFALLNELYKENYFTEKSNKFIAKNLIKNKKILIELFYRKNEIKDRIFKKIFKAPSKEKIVPDYDDETNLQYPFKITVFTPVYNRRRTIHRVFDSLMLQTTKNFEWLIVDDGSKDNLKELIDEYKAKADFKIRYYYKENGGKHTAVNWAYNLTDSEYFLTLDSDDAFLPEAVETFMRIWDDIPKEKRNDYWSVVARCQNAWTGKLKGGLYPDGINEMENPEKEAAKIDDDKISCPRTEVLKQFPFPEPEGTTFVTESIVWNKINRCYKQYYTNEILHNVYQGEADSITTSWYKNHIKEGYVSNYFWMCSQINDSYQKNKILMALKAGYYGYVSDKKLKEIIGGINSKFYRFICVAEYPFLFILKKLRYSKYEAE